MAIKYIHNIYASMSGAVRSELIDEAFRTGDIDALCAFAATARPEEYERFRTARRAEVRAAFVSADGRDPADLAGMAETETAYWVRLALAGVRGLPASDYDTISQYGDDKHLAETLLANPTVPNGRAARWAAGIIARLGDSSEQRRLWLTRPEISGPGPGISPIVVAGVIVRLDSRAKVSDAAVANFIDRMIVEHPDGVRQAARHLAAAEMRLVTWQRLSRFVEDNVRSGRSRGNDVTYRCLYRMRRDPDELFATLERGELDDNFVVLREALQVLAYADPVFTDRVLALTPLHRVKAAVPPKTMAAYLGRRFGDRVEAWQLFAELAGVALEGVVTDRHASGVTVGDVVAQTVAAVGGA